MLEYGAGAARRLLSHSVAWDWG